MLRIAYVPADPGALLDEETIAHLHSGCSLILGTVSASGAPHASRGWGLTVLPGEPTTVRLLLNADDNVTLDNVRSGGWIAITSADVRSLHSLQLKGHVLAVEPVSADDEAKAAQYTDDFLGEIAETDGMPWDLLRAWAAARYVACTVEVSDCFVQTPGPSAGTPFRGGRGGR